MNKEKLKQIITEGLHKKLKYINTEDKEYLYWSYGRYFNLLDDNHIRGSRINAIKEILTENNIQYKINIYLIGVFADRIEEIELI